MEKLDDRRWAHGIATLRGACEAGAAAAWPWVGRLNKETADSHAAEAMRAVLRGLGMPMRVIAGEGEKDGVEHLAVGEIIGGASQLVGLDLAVDPIEGTTNLAHGLPWALCVAAATPSGGMYETGASLYMDKLVVPPAAAAHIDPEAGTADRLAQLARALGRPVSTLRVFVLDKPRHKALAAEIVGAGARIALFSAGDVVGTCATAMGEHFDAVMGIGGTPEGVLSACAVRALGGGFFARLAPQRAEEAEAMQRAAIPYDRWLTVSEMIPSERAVFCAAGITESLLTPGIVELAARTTVSTLLIQTHHDPMARVARHLST